MYTKLGANLSPKSFSEMVPWFIPKFCLISPGCHHIKCDDTAEEDMLLVHYLNSQLAEQVQYTLYMILWDKQVYTLIH